MLVEGLLGWVSGHLANPHNLTLSDSISDVFNGSSLIAQVHHFLTVPMLFLLEGGRLFYILVAIPVLFLLWRLYRLGFAPLDINRDMMDVGWGCLPEGDSRGSKLADKIREVQRLRRTGNLPPVFPNGWIAVAESRSVSVNRVILVQAFGESLAVYRDSTGKAHVVDAYCPHLGANMAVGGVVKGDSLECPFHGWLFRGSDGQCVNIPYTGKVPRTAQVRAWETRDVNGNIFVWHDAEGRAPTWHLPEIEEITRGTWHYRGRTCHQVLAHVQEIPENGADLSHLAHLHVPNIFKGADLRDAFTKNQVMDVAQHSWAGEWQACPEPDSHKAEMTLSHAFSIFGGKCKLFSMTVRAEQIGPGVVHLHFKTTLGSGVLIQTVTSVEPLRQKVVHQFYTSRSFIAPYAKFVMLCEASHLERDIMVWNNKQYLSQPLLVSEDRTIRRFRRWYSQFYSDNSKKFAFRKEEGLDW